MDMKITNHACGYEPNINCKGRQLIGYERVFHVFANSSWEKMIINIRKMCVSKLKDLEQHRMDTLG